jgi:hypothetical protein
LKSRDPLTRPLVQFLQRGTVAAREDSGASDSEERPITQSPLHGTAAAYADSMTSPPKLLDRVRTAIRTRHYSRRTEEAYVGWIRRFILFHQKRNPSEMGASEIGMYLSWLAESQHVSASTQNQARSA